MENILSRIQILSDNEGIKITSLERDIGASKGVLSRAIANNTDIQAKWLQKIVEKYPQYNANWLLTGQGPMLKMDTYNKVSSQPAAPAESNGPHECIYKDMLEKKEVEIKALNREIGVLSRRVEELREHAVKKPAGFVVGPEGNLPKLTHAEQVLIP